MTVRVERVFEVPAAPAAVWEFISDPRKRAETITVVDDFETTGPETAVWHVRLPIPGLRKTVSVETEDLEREEPHYVRFVGRSRVMTVEGEHTLTAVDGGTRVTNSFVVDGRLPGVERYFERTLDDELSNLEAALREALHA